MVRVSIIVPVYNVEEYLEDCLDSVINQTLGDIEVICVNDFSTDNSISILKKYVSIDNRIILLNNKKNYGQSYSRNRGLEIAKGEYIYFLDSDDMIVKEAMEELYYICKRSNLDGIFFDSTLLFESDELKKKFIGYSSERNNEYGGIYKGQELFEEFLKNRDWSASPPRQFWKRSYLLNNNLKFSEGIIHEDELFTFFSLIKAMRVSCIKGKYFIRRFRNNSTMTSIVSIKNFEGVFICYCEVLSFWRDSNFTENINNAIELYISRLYKRAKEIYKIISDEENVFNLDKGNVITNHLLKVFLLNMKEEKKTVYIDKDKLEFMKQFKNIIIYGSGTIAKEVLNILDKNEVGIYGFAVSDKIFRSKYIMGNKVYCIDELIKYKENAIVLVTEDLKNEGNILVSLKNLGFKNIDIIV